MAAGQPRARNESIFVAVEKRPTPQCRSLTAMTRSRRACQAGPARRAGGAAERRMSERRRLFRLDRSGGGGVGGAGRSPQPPLGGFLARGPRVRGQRCGWPPRLRTSWCKCVLPVVALCHEGLCLPSKLVAFAQPVATVPFAEVMRLTGFGRREVVDLVRAGILEEIPGRRSTCEISTASLGAWLDRERSASSDLSEVVVRGAGRAR